MAARDPAQRERETLQRAVAFDRVARVLRAARIETAVRAQQWSQRELVDAHEQEQQASHAQAPLSSLSISSAASAATPGSSAATQALRRRTMTSKLCSEGRLTRIASRSILLSRLRSTARGTCFAPMTHAKRPADSGAGANSSWTRFACRRLPTRKIRANAAAPRSRWRRVK